MHETAHMTSLVLAYVQLKAMVDRTCHHANRPILIEG
jgi:hypothetical protein